MADNANATLEPRVPLPVPRTVDAGRGATWWAEGWRLFTAAPLPWIGIIVLLALITVVLHFIPFVGSLAGTVLTPVFAAGILIGCRELDDGRPLSIGHLFAGFDKRFGALAVIGLIYLLGTIVILAVAFGVAVLGFGASGLTLLWTNAGWQDFALVQSALLGMLVAMLVFLALIVPLVMAIWFAPGLVAFHAAEPVAAMKSSFQACLSNMVPFLLYGAIGILLSIAASIPALLGWLIVGPMTSASYYASYADIFASTMGRRTSGPSTRASATGPP